MRSDLHDMTTRGRSGDAAEMPRIENEGSRDGFAV